MYDEIIKEEKDVTETKSNSSLTDFDNLFNNLTSDVDNINRFISNLADKKKNYELAEKELKLEKERLDKSKVELEESIKFHNEELKQKQVQMEKYIEFELSKIKKSEENFKNNMNSTLEEFELEKKSLEIEKENLKQERDQFEKYKEVTLEKIELENRSLEEKCLKFKEIMSQFDLNFKPILDEE